MIQAWKPVPGYEGLYEVSDLGRVRSVARQLNIDVVGRGGRRSVRERILVQKFDGHYCSVSLSRDGQYKNFLVHRLVLAAFVGPCPQGMEGRHFPDRHTKNNALSNLSWGTPSQNQADRIVHGTDDIGKPKRRRLAPDTEADIRAVYRSGRTTQRDLAERYGVSLCRINHIVNEKRRSGDQCRAK
jgi:hypothetical protein